MFDIRESRLTLTDEQKKQVLEFHTCPICEEQLDIHIEHPKDEPPHFYTVSAHCGQCGAELLVDVTAIDGDIEYHSGHAYGV